MHPGGGGGRGVCAIMLLRRLCLGKQLMAGELLKHERRSRYLPL